MPLAFGPNYARFKEACDLIAAGGACSISNYDELEQWFSGLLTSEEAWKHSSTACAEYVQSHKGATEQIMSVIGN